jgi:hypothetical protein
MQVCIECVYVTEMNVLLQLYFGFGNVYCSHKCMENKLILNFNKILTKYIN